MRGALWMVLACFLFMTMSAMIRKVSADIPAFEMVAIRNVFSLLTVLPFLLRLGRGALYSSRPGLLVFRSVIMICTMMTWILAVQGLNLADATALSFSAPLFATVGAALFLGEKVGLRRWTAIAVGFAGMLIIVRPGIVELSIPAMLAMANAVMTAINGLTAKVLTRTERPETIVLYLYVLTMPLSAIPAIFVWQTPAMVDVFWLAVMGVLVALGHICLTRAYAAADASAIQPYDFAKVVFASIIGFVLFSELPDLWTWLGIFIIFAATVYTARREAIVSRASRELTGSKF